MHFLLLQRLLAPIIFFQKYCLQMIFFIISVILEFPLKFSLQETFIPFSSLLFTASPLISTKKIFDPSEHEKKQIVFVYFPHVSLGMERSC